MVTTVSSGQTALRGDTPSTHDVLETFVDSFDTKLGWMAIAWQDEALLGNVFGHASRRDAELALATSLRLDHPVRCSAADAESHGLPGWIKEVADSLQRYAAGEPVCFADVPLSLDHLTPFARRVVAVCRQIEWGQTRSYGDLASMCKAPGAARAVGTVMAKNRFPLIIPCHRVLAAGGALGGYSAPQGLTMKRRLLTMESSLAG